MTSNRFYFAFILLTTFSIKIIAQPAERKILDHSDFLIWKTIEDARIGADGRFIAYRAVPGEGDAVLKVYDSSDQSTYSIDRVKLFSMDYSGKYIVGLITPYRDTLRQLERKKVDKKKWPCDTLVIYQGDPMLTVRIPYVSKFQLPAKAEGWLAYTIDDKAITPDSISEKKKSKKDITHLVVRELATGKQDTLFKVKEWAWAEKAPVLLAYHEGRDSTEAGGVVYWQKHAWTKIKKQKGEYTKLSVAPLGNQLAFLGNLDTTKAQVPPYELFYYDFKTDSAITIASRNKSTYPLVSQHADLQWSEDGQYLFYGRSEIPPVKDTTKLADEIIDVEVWSTSDPVLYTVQNVNKANEEKRSYTHVYDTQSRQHTPVQSTKWESAAYTPDRKGRYVLLYTEKPYDKEATWTGEIPKDLAKVDLLTGAVIPFKKGLVTSPRLSPSGKYAYGYSKADSTWWAYQMASGTYYEMKTDGLPLFADELNDVPNYAHGYGSAGWVQEDQSLLLYDRFDIWAWTPQDGKAPVKLTNGRENKIIHRYISTDPEQRFISISSPWLIHLTNDSDKSTGYSWFDPMAFKLDSVALEPIRYSRQVTKARLGNSLLFTKESFEVFPDLQISTDSLKTSTKISDVNPQQKNYLWGTIQLYRWMDWDSTWRNGLLVLPPGYDTLRTYPTIVNFYERSTDELYDHPTPTPHRSTINYAFYASRGYVIFNPDIEYETGKPGESAYQIVMSGVTSLVRDRIADHENMALQGHSWGGYQIAYILTRTNMFKCAEAGAAVVNMTSAYGGIRWGTGMARMFQYEKEQSRLGKTLWQDPQLYLINSPLFKLDKIETPLLLMHNDEDAAVPFEQAIEFYLALRRLGKTAWLLNYRGEPHWPVKWENKKDFNIRMSQFFDHYLKGAAMPSWMKDGIPAVERGVNRGY